MRSLVGPAAAEAGQNDPHLASPLFATAAFKFQRNMQGLVHMALEFGDSSRLTVGICSGDGSGDVDLSRRPFLRLCKCTEVCHFCRDIMARAMGASKHLGAWFKHNPLAFFSRWMLCAPKDTDRAFKALLSALSCPLSIVVASESRKTMNDF